VRLPQRLYVTEHHRLARFGQVVVSAGDRLSRPTSVFRPEDPRRAALQQADDLGRLIVDDGTDAQNPDPIVLGRAGRPLSADNTLRGGDVLRGAVGVLSYAWGGNPAPPDAFRPRAEGALGNLDGKNFRCFPA
jgi:uncharacterized protein